MTTHTPPDEIAERAKAELAVRYQKFIVNLGRDDEDIRLVRLEAGYGAIARLAARFALSEQSRREDRLRAVCKCGHRADVHHNTGCAACWQMDRPCYDFSPPMTPED